MTLQIPLRFESARVVRTSAQQAFALLSDVPRSAAHYPGLARLNVLPDGVYRWEMEPIGHGPVRLATVYAARYRSSRRPFRVTWTPVPGLGNAQVSGQWLIEPLRQGVRLHLQVSAELHLEIPSLMRTVAQAVAEAEFARHTQQYLESIANSLEA